jgi:hypothetical protein
VGSKPFIANSEICITEEQLLAADIQGALSKKLLIITDGPTQNNAQFSKITNLSFSSVSLPGANTVLRAGKSIDIRTDLLELPVYKKMVDDGLIAVDIEFKTGAKKISKVANAEIKSKKKAKKEEPDPIIPANMQIGKPITVNQGTDANGRAVAEIKQAELAQRKPPAKKGTPDKKTNKHAVRKVESDGLLLDLNAPDVEEEAEDFLLDPRTGKKVAADEGIIFVDQEQAQQRMNPKLKGKK